MQQCADEDRLDGRVVVGADRGLPTVDLAALDPDRLLTAEAKRLLQDGRADALATNFAGQWLELRSLEEMTPDPKRFPTYTPELRDAMRSETELFFREVLRENLNVLKLIDADFTFLNGPLARHYDIEGVEGDEFQRVTLDKSSRRGGILTHASILTITSNPTRTSPVIRGKWVLENLLGVPPPPPPAAVPALKENPAVGKALSVRERLAEHRAKPACAGCHNLMDPVGFSLENFDAVGRWRTVEEDKPIDVSGGLPDGSEFTGVSGLQQALLRRPDIFVGNLAEKLLTFALGRGVEYYDAPAVRRSFARRGGKISASLPLSWES